MCDCVAVIALLSLGLVFGEDRSTAATLEPDAGEEIDVRPEAQQSGQPFWRHVASSYRRRGSPATQRPPTARSVWSIWPAAHADRRPGTAPSILSRTMAIESLKQFK